ncbi:Shikimate dehydrogenase (NADP(+)) [Dyadobacter sp. CECT 9275]|uniref:Shikimate dehydrogenase (NADP(+)) n=1 Tax=Dyadobacter helix TaxID=2822344 RepID=A0A916J9J3_9BACT|nr:shikimate dehydrogenase [Dyadobacter sp. CECT 9275]CAG4988930.1 Shikimate dehydrogenase (NADP(+)) [Dyadobacter sp. CECT 9275]
MDLYGLIGFPLSHSFSKKYFTEKFEREGIKESSYDLYEMPTLDSLPSLLKSKADLKGLNVTIPHKKEVITYLDDLDEASAERIGAVNTIKVYADGSTKGFNTDYYGFRQSLVEWLDKRGETCSNFKALVLGNGGAAKAVQVALQDLHVEFRLVSRQKSEDSLLYEEITEDVLNEYLLIINTTPLGTYPKIEGCPSIPFQWIGSKHFLYDLVYNPAETSFLKNGAEKGAATLNGLKMLELQAEKAWDIWTTEEGMWSV